VRVGSIQRETVVASLVLAGAFGVGAGIAGHMVLGAAVGAGLLIGSLNGFVIQTMLDRGAPMLAAGFIRLALFTLLALLAARLMGASVWPVALGVAGAQMVMVAVGVRQGRRA